MPANIEIKGRTPHFEALRRRAEALSDTPVEVIPQEDIFFHTGRGRLKLRILGPEHAQLIFYARPDASGPKRSDYHVFETGNPEHLKTILSLALGVRGVVKKIRLLYLVGQIRIHLDDIEGLGHFVELEVVMREGQSDSEGRSIAEDLMQKLGIVPEDLLEGAYMDLLENSSSP
jgi:predicted adenylyl cyclase CyaB